MKLSVFLRYSVLPLLPLCIPAITSAQQTIRCKSNDGGRKYWEAGTNNPNQVSMQRQISGSPWVAGSTWGVDRRGSLGRWRLPR